MDAKTLWEHQSEPGKFEGEPFLTSYLWNLSLEGGGSDDSISLGDGEGCYELFLSLDQDENIKDGLDGTRAAILFERSNGFVDSTFFDSNEEAEKEWKQISDSLPSEEGDVWEGEEEEEEEATTYRVRLAAYCGMSFHYGEGLDLQDARDAAAKQIRKLRRLGHPVVTLRKGFEWESMEPEDAALVPDTAGLLFIKQEN